MEKYISHAAGLSHVQHGRLCSCEMVCPTGQLVCCIPTSLLTIFHTRPVLAWHCSHVNWMVSLSGLTLPGITHPGKSTPGIPDVFTEVMYWLVIVDVSL